MDTQPSSFVTYLKLNIEWEKTLNKVNFVVVAIADTVCEWIFVVSSRRKSDRFLYAWEKVNKTFVNSKFYLCSCQSELYDIALDYQSINHYLIFITILLKQSFILD